jgi:hypothetical protein
MAIIGCASPERKIPTNSSPSKAVGYIGGNFTTYGRISVMAFIFTNLDTKREYIYPFIYEKYFYKGYNETSLIQLPPGTYKATRWILYNPGWGPGFLGLELEKEITSGELPKPIQLKENEVVFLGKFDSNSEWTLGYTSQTTTAQWKSAKISNEEAKEVFIRSYPAFSSMEFTCITCQK